MDKEARRQAMFAASLDKNGVSDMHVDNTQDDPVSTRPLDSDSTKPLEKEVFVDTQAQGNPETIAPSGAARTSRRREMSAMTSGTSMASTTVSLPTPSGQMPKKKGVDQDYVQHFPHINDWRQVSKKKARRTTTTTPWRPSLLPLIERRPQNLNPLQDNGAWEYFEAILDSGASVTVIPPSLGKGYDILEGEASKLGITYEVANGEVIPNLGEKCMAIMTGEGTTRGLRAQVAEVSKPLQAVRSLVRTGHMVVFGDGEDGNANYVVNKLTGEVNAVRDDGTNYLMGMYIIPKAEMQAAGFARPAPQP